jgi:hypothetical protein
MGAQPGLLPQRIGEPESISRYLLLLLLLLLQAYELSTYHPEYACYSPIDDRKDNGQRISGSWNP